MRITKVYTRTGDKGFTRLVGGRKIRKDAPRLEAYGTVDELNTIVGLVRTFNGLSKECPEQSARLDAMLHKVQNDLFNVGSDLATLPEDRWEGMAIVGDEATTLLENWIDELNEDLEPLKEFILPGGGPVGSFFHQARTVCRRAERRIATLAEIEPELDLGPFRYINRLSDWLYVAGRWSGKAHNEPEYLWDRPGANK
jgi:cob(I)alamin adenosyltransferase